MHREENEPVRTALEWVHQEKKAHEPDPSPPKKKTMARWSVEEDLMRGWVLRTGEVIVQDRDGWRPRFSKSDFAAKKEKKTKIW